MMIRWHRFNIYLLLAVALSAVCGCNSLKSKKAKVASSLRLHQEKRADAADRTRTVELFRAQPFQIAIDKAFFLTENNVKEARVVDSVGGFSLQIQFDRKGSWLLEQYSAALKGKHVAIFSQFTSLTKDGADEARWLAAPLITTRIVNGLLVFTPDASREEAEQIALGLNNLAKETQSGPIQ